MFDVGEEGVVGRADGLEGDALVSVPRVDLGDGLRPDPAQFDEITKQLSRRDFSFAAIKRRFSTKLGCFRVLGFH